VGAEERLDNAHRSSETRRFTSDLAIADMIGSLPDWLKSAPARMHAHTGMSSITEFSELK